MKQEDEFKCWTCASQQLDTAEESSGIEPSGYSLEAQHKFCYFVANIRARAGAVVNYFSKRNKRIEKFSLNWDSFHVDLNSH